MRLGIILIITMLALPATAGFRQAEATQEMMQELARRCEMHAKNDRVPFMLVSGRLQQSQFKAPELEPCTPTEDKVCPKRDWFPMGFTGVMTHSNRYKPRDQVRFTVKGFHKNDMYDLNFIVGKSYAFCATEGRYRNRPLYTIHNYFTIYELTSATKK